MNHFNIAKRISNYPKNDNMKEILWNLILNYFQQQQEQQEQQQEPVGWIYNDMDVYIQPDLPLINFLRIVNESILVKDLNQHFKLFDLLKKNEIEFKDILKNNENNTILFNSLYNIKSIDCTTGIGSGDIDSGGGTEKNHLDFKFKKCNFCKINL